MSGDVALQLAYLKVTLGEAQDSWELATDNSDAFQTLMRRAASHESKVPGAKARRRCYILRGRGRKHGRYGATASSD